MPPIETGRAARRLRQAPNPESSSALVVSQPAIDKRDWLTFASAHSFASSAQVGGTSWVA